MRYLLQRCIGSSTLLLVVFAVVPSLVRAATQQRSVDDGALRALRFDLPRGVAADNSGNIYIASANNHTIQKLAPAGVLTTLAGREGIIGSADGTGSAARFNNPWGVATDGSGNVYVADTGNHMIRKITPAGEVTTLAGLVLSAGNADGIGKAARFNTPHGVATDSSGNLYVADTYNNTIRKITPAGSVTTLAGLAGTAGSADGNGRAARFSSPWGVTTDSSGNIYVADRLNATIRKITPEGTVTTLAGLARSSGKADGIGSAARFVSPAAVATDGTGNIYVADTSTDSIRKITPEGVVSTLAGLGGNTGSVDATRSAARFSYPSGVAIDSRGDVYVADAGNKAIRKITPARAVTTVARSTEPVGNREKTGAVTSMASARRFLVPLPNATSYPTGDGNGDGVVNVADVFYLINDFFTGGPPPAGSADINGDGQVNVADIFYLINYLFAGGPAPH